MLLRRNWLAVTCQFGQDPTTLLFQELIELSDPVGFGDNNGEPGLRSDFKPGVLGSRAELECVANFLTLKHGFSRSDYGRA